MLTCLLPRCDAKDNITIRKEAMLTTFLVNDIPAWPRMEYGVVLSDGKITKIDINNSVVIKNKNQLIVGCSSHYFLEFPIL